MVAASFYTLTYWTAFGLAACYLILLVGQERERLRDVAHKEMEIARLMGPSDDLERDWLRYLEQLVELTDAWLRRAGGGGI